MIQHSAVSDRPVSRPLRDQTLLINLIIKKGADFSAPSFIETAKIKTRLYLSELII